MSIRRRSFRRRLVLYGSMLIVFSAISAALGDGWLEAVFFVPVLLALEFLVWEPVTRWLAREAEGSTTSPRSETRAR